MKTNSDNFSCFKRNLSKVAKGVIATILFVSASATLGFSQDLIIIEGSIRNFSVEDHPESTFKWTLNDESFNLMDQSYCDFYGTQYSTDITVRFNDMNRISSQLVYLAVTETRNVGCSTTRALKILIEPNNMYLEFASAMTQDCFTGTEYNAPLKVGLNFKDKAAGVPIPESRFPLRVEYTVRNITAGTPAVDGNSGNPLTMQYSPENDYALLVTEAVGAYNETTEYELTITSVRDKYDAEITNNIPGDIRIQIRVINHLPQSGNMDMALAYYEVIKR